jgi:pimeloyl-ACP methyl ester carboxylesterase
VVLIRRALVALCLLLLAAGCRSAAERFLEAAAGRGLRAQEIEGAGFRHVVLSRGAHTPGTTLHVYLDGDGVPWLGGYPTADPTPRDPLVLDLMTLDPGPAVYLGRPCYHGLGEPSCSSELWTSARYSAAVVDSMAAAARSVLSARGAERVVWLGYSGGGALAVLLAARLPETAGVVTVAANLDVEAWAEQQGWSPLTGSLNPARQPPLPRHVYQRHYAGGRDRTVPPETVPSTSDLVVVEDYDHRCCWALIWPAVLADLERGLRERRD